MTALLSVVGLQLFAQLNGNGYYRVHNYATGRYFAVHDNKGSVERHGTTVKYDMGAIELMDNLSDVISDPGSVVYIKDLGSNYYSLRIQGMTSEELMKGYKFSIGASPVGENLYRASVRGSAYRAVLGDDGGEVLAINTDDEHCAWYITPVNNTGENYFGVAAQLAGDGKYYATLFTDFAFQLPMGMKAYVVNRFDAENRIVLKEVAGKVPAQTPVVLECTSADPAVNKLLPIDETVPSAGTNHLKGVFFNIDKVINGYPHTNHVAFNAANMRVLKVTPSGDITFSTTTEQYIPANTAYVALPSGKTFGTDVQVVKENVAGETVYVRVNDCTMAYGDPLPKFTYTVEGGTLNGTPTLTCNATSESAPGTYTIKAEKGSVTNSSVVFYNGTLTITKAPLTITANSYTRKYGEANPKLEITYTGFKNNENNEDLKRDAQAVCEATPTSPVGTYPIVVSGALSDNYEITHVNGQLNVEKTPLQVTADNFTIKQGEEIPQLTFTYSGFVNEENEDVLDKKPTISCDAVVGSAPGTYDIVLQGGEDNNYEFAYTNGVLTVINADAIIVKVGVYNIVYGEAIPEFTYTVEGGTLEGEPVVKCAATDDSNVGQYPITLEMGTIANYNVTLVNGMLNIAKAPLTATVGNYSRYFGEENPEFVVTVEGFVKNQTEDVLISRPVATTTATWESPEGDYVILVSGGEATNYFFRYINGTLTVLPASAIESIIASGKAFDVYTTSGVRVKTQVRSLEGLAKGLYIINGKKVAVN